MAQISSKFRYIAADIYRRNYSDYEIQVQLEQTKNKSRGKPYNIYTLRKIITIDDLASLSIIMEYFGNNIHKINILNMTKRNYTLGSDWAEVNRIVNEYAWESMTHLKLGFISNTLWPLFTMPFKSVESLSTIVNRDTDGMKLNELCPNLRELHIYLIGEVNYDFIDCKIPHLQHLDMSIEVATAWNNKEQIIGLIQKNPQIRSVDATNTRPEFSKVINQYLPDLENLTFHYDDNQDEPLHFEHVKNCALSTLRNCSIKTLSFSHLESLEIMYFPAGLNAFIEFFHRHKNISRLHFTRTVITTTDLEQITAELPNLVEVIVDYLGSYSNMENISRFIESRSKLMKFQFRLHDMIATDRNQLREDFERNHSWFNVNYIEETKKFFFERKKQL